MAINFLVRVAIVGYLAYATASASSCPQIWSTIVADLQQDLAGCTPLTAFAIRFAFHDGAGYSNQTTPYPPASGGADGSMLLSPFEAARTPSAPLEGYRQFLLEKYGQYNSSGVSAADLIQMAGSVGVRSCPGGPVYKTVVGRKDTSRTPPAGLIPVGFGPNSTHEYLVNLWADKGFDQREVVALIGAHTISRSFAQESHGIPPGGPQDTSPSVWNTQYFSQTQAKVAPQGVYRFHSDTQLATPNTLSGKAFTEFAGNAGDWATAFSAAMFKLSVTGIPQDEVDQFIDCTSLVEAITPSAAPSAPPSGFQGPFGHGPPSHGPPN